MAQIETPYQDQFDRTGIFSKKAGRAPTQAELSQLQGLDLNTNPALAVSQIQKFALGSTPSGNVYEETLPKDLSQLKVGDGIITGGNLGLNNSTLQGLINGGNVTSTGDNQYQVTSPTAPGLPSQTDALANRVEELMGAQTDSIESSRLSQIEAAKQAADKQLQDRTDVGGRQTGQMKRLLGRAGGFTTTAGGQALQTQEQNLQNDLNKVKETRQQVINQINSAAQQNNLQAMQAAQNTLLDLDTRQREIEQQRFQNLMAINDQQLSIAHQAASLPAGQSFEVGGQTFVGQNSSAIDPFFKGSDIIRLMTETPSGQMQTITDPNTGVVFEFEGMSSADPNKKTFTTTGDDGSFRIITFNPYSQEIESVATTGEGVGKSKTGPSMVSVQFPKQQRTPLYDSSGNQIGFQTFNPIDLSVQNFDLQGSRIDSVPEGARLGTFGSEFDAGDGDFF